ncbi:MAG TPA: nitrate/nitrite transporter NrtS [Thermomicrobiales bacterium]|nr:nitrate/nitrite transporter NrtS [Thermomicrobiales bacterium]
MDGRDEEGHAGRPARLTIVVAPECPACAEARAVAREMQGRFPALVVEVLDLDDRRPTPPRVVATPTYLLDGQVIALGNPGREALARRITDRRARHGGTVATNGEASAIGPSGAPPADEGCCTRCGRPLTRRLTFALAGGPRCLRCALRFRPMLRRSTLTSLVVGSTLTAINHGPALVAGHPTPALAWQIPLTYGVPFCVATWGALSTSRR